MKRFSVALVALVIILVLVVGCSTTSTSTPPTTTSAAPTSSAPTTAPATSSAKPSTSAQPTTTASQTPSMQPVTLTFNGAQFAATDAPGRTYLWFCDTVTQRTNGLIKFKFVGSNSLTKPGEEMTALQNGLADVSAMSAVYYPSQMYVNSGFNRAVPFDIADIPAATKVMYKLYYEDPVTSKILSDEFTKLGMKLLLMTVDDSYVVESKNPIMTLDDLKGKKLACLGYEAKYFGPTGATVVGMPAGDRSTALQTGVIDGASAPFEISYSFRTYEFAPNMIQTGFGCVTGNAIAWNLDKFNKLPKDIQDILIQTGKDAFNQNAVEAALWYGAALATRGQSTGAKPYLNFSAADLARWAGLVGEPVFDWLTDAKSKNVVGAEEVVTRFIALEKETGYAFPKEWKIK